MLAILRQLCAVDGHQFWPDDVSLRDVLRPGAVVTHAQITDIFLLALAVNRAGGLATFDARIPTAAMLGGERALELVPA